MAEVSNHFLHSGMREKIQLIKIEKRKAKNEFSKHFIALTSTHHHYGVSMKWEKD